MRPDRVGLEVEPRFWLNGGTSGRRAEEAEGKDTEVLASISTVCSTRSCLPQALPCVSVDRPVCPFPREAHVLLSASIECLTPSWTIIDLGSSVICFVIPLCRPCTPSRTMTGPSSSVEGTQIMTEMTSIFIYSSPANMAGQLQGR